MTKIIHDVVIIGSGPAGYTAAIYTARSNLSPVLYEGILSGGALINTTEVENYPGFPAGILGPDLMTAMKEQAEKFGTYFIAEDVISTQLSGEIKTITTENTEILTKTVILAMGSTPQYLDIPGEAELVGKGVSFCATCDGFFFKGKDIAIVGGGDTAMVEAIFLTKFANSVTIIHRRENFRASSVMVERAKNNPKISFLTNTVVSEICGNNHLDHIIIKNLINQKIDKLDVAGLFIAIGHIPQSKIVQDEILIDEKGYIIVKGRTSQTNIPGVFAAGDIIDPFYQQAVTAAGSGCIAALDADHFLSAI